MTDLHPHWHSTGDDDIAARTSAVPAPAPSAAAGNPYRVSVRPASRLPGAMVGIVAFSLIGFTLAGGWQAMNAQVSGTGGTAVPVSSSTAPSAVLPVIEIRITGTTGFQPASVTVKPGQTITWINDQSIPHILTSQTLRDGSGAYLNTPAIFPGSKESFTIGKNEPDREHSVNSTTDQTLRGTIIVSSVVESSSSSKKGGTFGGLDDVNLPSGQGSSKKKSTSKSSSSKSTKSTKSSSKTSSKSSVQSTAPAVTASSAPSLPPTTTTGTATSGAPAVDTSIQVFPTGQSNGTTLDTYAAPGTIEPVGSGPQNSYPPVTPQPLEQPHTGPGLWAVFAISIALLWLGTRKYFVRI